MPSRLTEAHIRGEKRIRDAAVRAVAAAWQGLPGYDEANVDEFLSRALPAVRAGVRSSALLTAAYIDRALERQPRTFDPDQILNGLRNGVPLEEVYQRPFVTVWGDLAAGALYADAVKAGLDRTKTLAATDPQLAMRDTARQLDNGYGYRRVADSGACEFCQAVNGAYVKGNSYVMALHPFCGCSLEALTEPHKGAVLLPDGTEIRPYAYGPLNDKVAVQPHGELGAVLGDPSHNFTSQSEIANRR